MKKTIMATIVTMTLSGNAMAYDTVLADRINPETGVISNGVVWEQNVDLVTEKELTQKLSELPVGNVGNIGSGSFAGQSDNNFDVDMGDVAGNVGNICSGTATGNAVITCDIEIENANIENANVSFDDLTEAQKESLQGADGEDGRDGIDGKDGAQGEKGDTGEQGIQGVKGDTGAVGADGKDGRDGVDGQDGVDGKDGAKGEKGEQGIQGEKGETGDSGSDGKDGQDGKDGINGVDGKDGITTIVNEYDKIQVDSDFVSEEEFESGRVTADEVIGNDGVQDQQHVWGDSYLDADIIDKDGVMYGHNNTSTDGEQVKALDLATQKELDKVDDKLIKEIEDRKNADKKVLADSKKYTNQKHESQQKDIDKNTSAIKETNGRIDSVVTEQAKTDAAQDKKIARVESESIARDEVQDVKINDNSQAISDNRENTVNNTVAIRKEEQARKDADVQLASQISEEALIRAEQDALTLAEAQLYADTGIQRQALEQAKVDQAQDQRITKNEQAISGLQQDVAELNGIVAGTLAASTFEMPMDWNGDWAIQAGIGGYKGANALALGVVTAGEGYAVRATVTGSDADDFSELAYGASVTLSTALFD